MYTSRLPNLFTTRPVAFAALTTLLFAALLTLLAPSSYADDNGAAKSADEVAPLPHWPKETEAHATR